jgi:hypothetical protein
MSNLIRQDCPAVNTLLGKILSSQDNRILVELINSPSPSAYTIQKSNILSNGFTYEDEYLRPGEILKIFFIKEYTVQAELRELSIYPGNIISISSQKFNIEYILNGVPTKLYEIPIEKLKSTEAITIGTPLKVYASIERVVGFAVVKSSMYGNSVSSIVNTAPDNYKAASAPVLGECNLDCIQASGRSAGESKGELYDGLLRFCGKLQKQHLKLLKLIKKGIKNDGVLDIPSLSIYLNKTPDLSNYSELSPSGVSRKFVRTNKKIVEKAQKINNSSISLRKCQICSKPSREFQLGCKHFICGEDLRKHLSEKVELKVSDWDYSYSLYAPCLLCKYNLSELELKTIMDLDVSSLVAEQVENIKREALKNNQTYLNMQMSTCSRCMQYKQREAFNYQKECSCLMCKECFIFSNSAYICRLCSYRPTNVYPIDPEIRQQTGVRPSSNLAGSGQSLNHQKGGFMS